MNLTVRAATHVGLVRARNEDAHAEWTPDEPGERERRGVLLVVADGMGGARAGDVASRLAVDTVVRTYREAPGVNVLAELTAAVAAANRHLHAENARHPELPGMGTTCTAAVVRGPEVFLAHIGDSRAYLVQGGRVRQLTRDHSLAAELVAGHHLTAEEARLDPRRNLLTRSMGLDPEAEVDAERADLVLARGDTLLLCSDGLYTLVEEDELARLVDGRPLDRACRELVALANRRGGTDNITVLAARIGDGEGTGGFRAVAGRLLGRPLLAAILFGLAALLVLGVLLGVLGNRTGGSIP